MLRPSFFYFMLFLAILTVYTELTMVYDGFERVRTSRTRSSRTKNGRRGNHITPYFSGKSQLIENTFDNFASVAGVNKRVGYFSSSSVAPYNTNFDGFYLDCSDGVEPTIKIWNDGTLTAGIPLSSWDNASAFASYDFDNFTVILWDFLWLGGTNLRLFIETDKGLVLAHTYEHASTKQGTFIKSPNHQVRYDIEGVTATGSYNSICSVVGTEGEFPGAGKPLTIYNPSAISSGSVGTIYALKGIKKLSSLRDIAVAVTRGSISNNTINDIGIGMILLNPTLSAPLSYATNDKIEEGTATNQTVTDVGRILATIPSGNAGSVSGVNDSILSNIPMDIENVSGEIVLAYMPTTSNQSVFGTLTAKIY